MDPVNMDKYRLVEEKIIGGNGFTNIEGRTAESGGDGMTTEGGDFSSCAVRVTQQAKPRTCITNAMNILNGNNHVELKAMGKAINKAVTIAEILKRKMPLHQVTSLSSCEIVNVFEPLEEGLDTVVNQHYVSCVTITLSRNLVGVDVDDIGYQVSLSITFCLRILLVPGWIGQRFRCHFAFQNIILCALN
mmetsp:Transcript_25283/g.49010  ORF Transcript_25283/g.49010 Transcript_25283/m.49010 type:complete len:190 (+) Transcript_25283:176-745(+)